MKPDKLGISITLAVLFWTLVLIIPILQQNHDKEIVEKTSLSRPSNMDFDTCIVSTFRTTEPFMIKINHEKVSAKYFVEVHDDPKSVLVRQDADYFTNIWSKTPDDRFIQISLEYPKYEDHQVLMEYESNGESQNIFSSKNGTNWCKIFEIQNRQNVKDLSK